MTDDKHPKERPIIFSGPMVRAILAGKKTQTRRVVKPQPPSANLKCPYEVGMRLWVRETWQVIDETISDQPGAVYRATDPDWESMDGWKWRSPIFMPRWASRLTLEVTDVREQRVQEISGRDCAAEGCEPDWEAFEYATIGADCWEEPEEFIEECEEECDWINYGNRLVHSSEHKEWERDRLRLALRLSFQKLWEELNAPRGFGWKANPLVRAITFKVVQ